MPRGELKETKPYYKYYIEMVLLVSSDRQKQNGELNKAKLGLNNAKWGLNNAK